jgi:hypothetical protein
MKNLSKIKRFAPPPCLVKGGQKNPMAITRNNRKRAVLGSVLGALVLFSTSGAFAASVPPLMTVSIGGQQVTLGVKWNVDTTLGTYTLAAPITATVANVGSFTIGGAFADTDPQLIFSASATNLTAGPLGYSFTFNTPLVPSLSGLVSSHAELGVTLTDDGVGGATISPFFPKMLTSVDLHADTSSISKNVDIGDLFSIVSGTSGTGFSKDSSLVCSPACVTMSSILAFNLSAGDSAGFSGKVVQVAPVPLPAAAFLFGSGLLGLAGSLRKKFSLA